MRIELGRPVDFHPDQQILFEIVQSVKANPMAADELSGLLQISDYRLPRQRAACPKVPTLLCHHSNQPWPQHRSDIP